MIRPFALTRKVAGLSRTHGAALIPSMLQRYVLRETVRVALISVAALTGIIFVGMGVSLVRQGLSVVQLRSVFQYVLAFSLPYALPTALLVTSVFVYGRLSGANEINAIRSSGVNLNHVILPPLLLAVVVSVGTLGLGHYVLPWSLSNVKVLRDRLIMSVLKSAGDMQKLYPLGAYQVYVGGTDEKTGLWKNVAVIQFAADEYPAKVMIAERAHCSVDEEEDVARLILFGGTLMEPELDNIEQLEESGALQFEQLRIDIPLHTELRMSPDRPKYLMLPHLLRQMRKLTEAKAEMCAQDPALAQVAHPRTERRLVERRADRTYREWQRVNVRCAALRSAADGAREEAEAIRREMRGPRAVQEAAAQRLAEAEAALAEHKPHLLTVEEEVRQLIQEQAEPERIRRRQEELEAATRRVAELIEEVAGAKTEVEESERTLKQLE